MINRKYKVNPVVLVGLPTLEERPISWEWADAYQSLTFPLGASISKLRIKGKGVAEARNEIVLEALRQDADSVLFIGDDVLPPPNLYDLLSRHKQPMVTGIYWSREVVSKPYIWRNLLDGPYQAWKAGEFFEVDWAGVDATLISTDVFRALEYPFFDTNWAFEEGQVPLSFATEDLYFYAKARAAGFKLYADTQAQCQHQDRRTGRVYGLTMDMPQAQPTAPHPSPDDPAPLVADIGAGHASPWFGANAIVTTYDGDPEAHPDVLCDVRAIPAPDEHFDIVHARHVLEHFAPFETEQVVREWLRILKVGGELRVNVPNIEYAAREILKGEERTSGMYPHWQIFGMQNGSEGELHRNWFNATGLRSLFDFLRLEDVTVEEVGEFGESLQATGRKVKSSAPLVVGTLLRDTWRREEVEAARGATVHDITSTMTKAEAAHKKGKRR